MFIIVDLPEPDGPTSATYSLRSMGRSMSASAVSSVPPIWYVLPMPRSSITRVTSRPARLWRRLMRNLLAVEQEQQCLRGADDDLLAFLEAGRDGDVAVVRGARGDGALDWRGPPS